MDYGLNSQIQMLMANASNSLKICTIILNQDLPLQRERLPFSMLNLSPLLFSIFLNDLKGFLHMHKAPGLTCNTNIDDHFLVYIKLLFYFLQTIQLFLVTIVMTCKKHLMFLKNIVMNGNLLSTPLKQKL